MYVRVTLLELQACLLLPKHPPHRKCDATQHTNGAQNEHDNKGLAHGSIKGRQRSTSPVDPKCGRGV
jgi:hypothetical protein